MTLQFEYLYVSENHRGKKLADGLITKLEENGLSMYPELKKLKVNFSKIMLSVGLLLNDIMPLSYVGKPI